jgi:hypothetical protein
MCTWCLKHCCINSAKLIKLQRVNYILSTLGVWIYISAALAIIQAASAGKVLAFESRRSSFSFSLFVPKLERAYHLDWNKFICFEMCCSSRRKTAQRRAAADVICLNWKWKCDVSIRAGLNNNYLDWRRGLSLSLIFVASRLPLSWSNWAGGFSRVASLMHACRLYSNSHHHGNGS